MGNEVPEPTETPRYSDEEILDVLKNRPAERMDIMATQGDDYFRLAYALEYQKVTEEHQNRNQAASSSRIGRFFGRLVS